MPARTEVQAGQRRDFLMHQKKKKTGQGVYMVCNRITFKLININGFSSPVPYATRGDIRRSA